MTYPTCSSLLLLLLFNSVYGQDFNKHKGDTIMLSRFSYAVLKTNNGSQCICYISNSSRSQNATVVNTGATTTVTFNDGTAFNGIHTLTIQQQIIAIADFAGSNLIISNLSPYEIQVIVMILCPKDYK
ncbi:hypothetical protein CLU83_0850 [Flavobacterium sp. 1]|uniref:hypothetical protein n=1 Tax=Flavobacterium sp. 1 TaxID=2035200 RepID=UPI000CAB1A02|nr:hypothetical protein [Flavobacterium sp. 1]PJJ07660.1 hypothetical protein CLU83_0850 [Flavobacterium sp. 1]